MSNKQPPQPSRFEVYKELPDRSGFTIAGTTHVFKFDRYGGWFDQYGNYYNENGSATDPPSDEEDNNYSDRSKSNHSDDEYDEFEKEFGRPKNYEEDDYAPNLIHYGRVATNLQILNNYPNNEAFRVNFRNISYFNKRDEIYKYFKDRVRGILNVVCNHNNKGQFDGTGYFVVQNYRAGEELIKLEGEKYGDREIKFDLEEVAALLQYPLSQHEKVPDFLVKVTEKKFFNSAIDKKVTSPPIEEPKKQTIKPVEQNKTSSVKIPEQSKKTITKPVEEKKQTTKTKEYVKKEQSKPNTQSKPKQESTSTKNQVNNDEQFAQYKFVRVHFPKKSSLKEWVVDNKFNHLVDVKEVQKIPGDDTHAKVTMKRKIYKQLNNTQYNGVNIVFTPL